MSQPLFPDLRGQTDAPEAYSGGEVNREWLLAAYTAGFFPWPDADEQLIWCNPSERMVFDPHSWSPPKRLVRSLRQGLFEVTFDTQFADVIEACRTVGRTDGTWITGDLVREFNALHAEGFAHSVEVRKKNELVGGLYGLSFGSAFFGESMFSRVPNGSKAALSVLLAFLATEGFTLFDAQVSNPHLVQLGGQPEPRSSYLGRLQDALQVPTRQGPWSCPAEFVESHFSA